MAGKRHRLIFTDAETRKRFEQAVKDAESAYRNAWIRLGQCMQDVRYIRIFIPGKARLAVTEIRVPETPGLNEKYMSSYF